jgi:hypothetical protein
MGNMYRLLISSLLPLAMCTGLDELKSYSSYASNSYDNVLNVESLETTVPKQADYFIHSEMTTIMAKPKSPSLFLGLSKFLQRFSFTTQVAILLSATSAGSFSAPQISGSDHGTTDVLNYTTAEAGNPFVDTWYADPDTAIYDGEYWVFPTSSYTYEEQTYLDAFSSPDLINWTKHSNILTTADVKWATKAVWAPAPAFRNGKYYLYFGANDIQEGEAEKGVVGGIGVAVADEPDGPYIDALGRPLIGEYHNGAQPIDQDVFIDDDGQAYIYYGGHRFANVAKLNEDMISLGKFDDNTTFKNITPTNYVEGPQMIKRNGIYYFMWSEGGWGGPDYSVSYAMANSPLGPFEKKAKILQQDSAVAKSSGHNGIIHIPDTDIYYIVYHRRSLSESAANHRVLAYDRMYFNEDGTIVPIRMLVKDNFADGNMIGWKSYGGEWEVVDQRLEVDMNTEAMALLDTNFTDLVFDATISLTDDQDESGSAGLVFRVNTTGTVGPNGYYVGLSPSGILSLETFQDDTRMTIAKASTLETRLSTDTHISIRVTATGKDIKVYVNDLETPLITVVDSTFVSGANGVRVVEMAASFGSVSILKPDQL